MLSMSRALSAALCGAALSVGSGAAQAQFSDDVIRIGFITDLSACTRAPTAQAASRPSAWPSRKWAARSTAGRSS